MNKKNSIIYVNEDRFFSLANVTGGFWQFFGKQLLFISARKLTTATMIMTTTMVFFSFSFLNTRFYFWKHNFIIISILR